MLPTLIAPGEWDSCSRPTTAAGSTRCSAPAARPPLVRAKGRRVTSARIGDVAEIPLPFLWSEDEELPPPRPARLAFVHVEYLDGEPETYVLPVAFVPGAAGERFIEDHPAAALALVRTARPEKRGARRRALAARLRMRVLSTLARRRRVRTELGSVAGVPGASSRVR